MTVRSHFFRSTLTILHALTAVGCCSVFALGGNKVALSSQNRVDFSREIRPILTDRCFACHGPDKEQRQADLRLDVREGAFAQTNGTRTIVAGDSSASELFRRISSGSEEERMPPANSGKELSAEEIELIRRWIDQGAVWQDHWAFVSPQWPMVPRVRNMGWPHNDIDRFILARLESEGLQPAPEADRRTLIRRISLDLTGLPPTPSEVHTFLADKRPDAWEQLVDRLFLSSRFGERMAMEWMDLARFADTHSYLEDYHRDMTPWRDWVIDAFNSDMPYDQFSIEQLAGDLLPESTSRQYVATGFNRNHGVTSSGISEEYRVEYVIDRVKTMSTVWLGLTTGCAQCHDHKYDPVSQRDFYRLFAFFNRINDRGVELRSGNVDPLIPILPPDQEMAVLTLDQQIADIDLALRDCAAKIDWEHAEGQLVEYAARSPWPKGLVAHYPLDQLAFGELANTVAGGTAGILSGEANSVTGRIAGALALNGGQSYVELSGIPEFNRFDTFSLGAWVTMVDAESGSLIARVGQNRKTDTGLQYHNPGLELTFADGKLRVYLTHSRRDSTIEIVTGTKVPPAGWHHVFVTYDGSSRARGVTVYFDGESQPTEIVEDHLRDSIAADSAFCLGRLQNGSFQGGIDDLRVYGRELTALEVARLAEQDQLPSILATARRRRSENQHKNIRRFYLSVLDAEYRKLATKQHRLRSRATKIRHNCPTVMVMKDMREPRNTYVLRRGMYDQHGEQVECGVPAALPQLPAGTPRTRLGLARWLMDPSHPLTARVTVNRFWQMVFGTGLVKTSGDFGIQGEYPSHPELLDWLAMEFVANGWDVKALLKAIVSSSTYWQSSDIPPVLLARDPENRLLARGPRFRMPAEMIRDNALAISGLLVEKLGGNSVKPYQPQGLWRETSNINYVQDHGDNLYRRSFYTYWKRSVPPPNLFAMDAPTRETCTARRQRTNTPLMALVLLNDPTFVEAARNLAQHMMTETDGSQKNVVSFGFERATARLPNSSEREVLLDIYRQEQLRFRSNVDAAANLLAVGESGVPPELDAADLAAWTCVASVILNLDETINKE